jgi:MoxR-like ATPase
VVIATQNPTGAAGTQLLPDSQMDRFTIRLTLGYPTPKDEAAMVLSRQGNDPLEGLHPILSRHQLTMMQETVEQTYISETVIHYIISLITATREREEILRGASPRTTLALTAMAKAIAQLRGRDYVIPADVREVFLHTVSHRLLLSARAENQGTSADDLLLSILDQVEAPKLR